MWRVQVRQDVDCPVYIQILFQPHWIFTNAGCLILKLGRVQDFIGRAGRL